MVKRLVDHGQAHGARRREQSGRSSTAAARMYLADILRALDVLGDRFVQIYGQGESPMTITALSRAQHADRSRPD
jgi:long-chain acyl-CoA synthetase